MTHVLHPLVAGTSSPGKCRAAVAAAARTVVIAVAPSEWVFYNLGGRPMGLLHRHMHMTTRRSMGADWTRHEAGQCPLRITTMGRIIPREKVRAVSGGDRVTSQLGQTRVIRRVIVVSDTEDDRSVTSECVVATTFFMRYKENRGFIHAPV